MKNRGTDFDELIRVLRAGGVIAHATDTCYGFACDALNEHALKKLYALKRMSREKPVSILVSDSVLARQYGVFDERARVLAEQYWPGALTVIVPRLPTLPPFLNPGSESVGIRVPDHAFSLELARRFGAPLTTTSANITALPSPYTVRQIAAQFEESELKPDIIVDGGDLDPHNLPSTIVDLTGDVPRIVRQGSLKLTF